MSGPFVQAAGEYLEAGWHPFPARHTEDGSKAPCVKGVIGWNAVDVTPELVAEWEHRYPNAQIGLRLPREVLGIDVDVYDGKGGARRLKELVHRYGPLAPTWKSTSRQDGSGIYLYRVDDSSQFPHDLTGGVEVIRWCGRFVMAAPSTHPRTGDQYGYVRPDGEFVLDEFPDARADLPRLRDSWAEGLATEVRQRASKLSTSGDVGSWLRSRPGGKDKPCEVMRNSFTKYRQELRDAGEGSRHSAALTGAHALIGDSADGHPGLRWCLARLLKTLIEKRGTHNEGPARDEFTRLVHSEVEKRMGQPVHNDDPCLWEFKDGKK